MVLASNLCTSHIQRVERQEGIPKNLLAAMARVESGRYNKANKTVEPWPWTVQSQGKSNYFSTKSEAVEHVKALQRKGVKNIDIGCMQMNLEHHGHKFSTIEQMFEPSHNVEKGAKYLKQLKNDKNKAWSTAVGNYHSFTPEHHTRYKNLVLKNLGLVNQEAGDSFDARSLSGGSLYPGGGYRGKAVRPSLYSYSHMRGLNGPKRPAHKQTHKIIKLSSKNRVAIMRGNGVKDLAFMNVKKAR